MDSTATPQFWKKCSSCKSEIRFRQKYWVCSVSTCTRQRTGLNFCKVSCFDAHVPMMNHKDAGAIEKIAPSLQEFLRDNQAEAGSASPVGMGTSSGGPSSGSSAVKREILVVVSKTKDYVRAKHGVNTSDSVMELLSDRIRFILDEAIQRAIQDGRKTLMDRDFK